MQIEIIRNAADEMEMEMFKGDYMIQSHFVVLEQEIGCQYIEFQLDVVPKRRRGRK